jgi:nitrite reductase/ring-hydroxylating ferredoxin subunit
MSAARARETRIPLAQAPAPGEVRIVEVGARRVALFCVSGSFHALADRCPHRGAPLCSRGEVVTGIDVRDGELVTGPAHALVRCPWHKWDFEIATGRCAVHPRLRVRRYTVRTDGHELVVSLDQDQVARSPECPT